MRIVFFGTPEFAVPTLDAIAAGHEIVLAIAQPDRPAGRGMKLQPPAVAVRARELGLSVAQPPKIRTPEFLASIAALRPDIGVVIAYGKILPAALLAIPKHGFINVHASILPKYRGAAPIQRAIESGETTTGVTIMRVDEELDHGPMLSVSTLEIGPEERTPSVAKRLAQLGAEAIVPALDSIQRGTVAETPQDHAAATIAPKIEKEEGAIRWTDPARTIFNRFRAFDPWPGIFFSWRGENIKLTNIDIASHHAFSQAGDRAVDDAGRIISIDASGVVIATGEGAIRIAEMQRPGKQRTRASDVARGVGWRVGDRLE